MFESGRKVAMRNMIIEYYSAEDCPKSTEEEIKAFESQLDKLSEGLKIFSDVSAGKTVSIRKLKRVLRVIRGQQKRNF